MVIVDLGRLRELGSVQERSDTQLLMLIGSSATGVRLREMMMAVGFVLYTPFSLMCTNPLKSKSGVVVRRVHDYNRLWKIAG